ncbi:MAG TPA: ribosomal L7Ae/L30e/S12e/Gadd45 family protein [Candidatus Nanoarchaeia archaeon]|nr:ribosomal L7Ae/L30e/S12e/Gadd45 family protein [Candidatus Nanoarchaeia archaeon]
MSVEEIKKMLKSTNLIIGADRTLKALRNNELTKIFLASNAPEILTRDIEHYASLVKVDVEKLEIPNDELGVVCKKPFLITCIGMKKVVEKKKY